MQIDSIDMWYGNTTDFFDSIHSTFEGCRKVGQEKTKAQMIKGFLLPKAIHHQIDSLPDVRNFFLPDTYERKRSIKN